MLIRTESINEIYSLIDYYYIFYKNNTKTLNESKDFWVKLNYEANLMVISPLLHYFYIIEKIRLKYPRSI